MNKLSDMPNIGATLEKMLISVGILTPEQLMEIGAIHACKRLKSAGLACYSKLYALEGAIQGVRWHELSPEVRTELKKQYDLSVKD